MTSVGVMEFGFATAKSKEMRLNPNPEGSHKLFKLFTFTKIFHSTMNFSYQGETSEEVMEAIETTDLMGLVVFNDDINTFEHVTQTLIKVCKHTTEQAEQCTWIIHFKGKCSVKSGSFDELKPMRESICEAGIDARIL